jgi:hypothetical protein
MEDFMGTDSGLICGRGVEADGAAQLESKKENRVTKRNSW